MLYTDPGSGILLWQFLAAGAVGAMFYVRKIIAFFRRKPSELKTEQQQIETR
jgi:hypothetical protein